MKKNIILSFFIALMSLSLIACGAESSSTNSSVNSSDELSTSQVNENASSSTEVASNSNAIESFEKMYEAGKYKVGTDFEAGTYILLAEDRGYFSVCSDANGNNILFNDNFTYDALIEVNDGEFIELSRCVAIDMEEFYASNTVSLEQNGGTFRVGYDIQPGEYKLTTGSDGGYYCIYEDLRQDYIIANDNFEKSTYVELQDGQYIILSRCTFSNDGSSSEKADTNDQSKYEKMYGEGKYKVGTDFDAGTYILLAEGKGYFSVTSDANGEDILFNDNFERNSLIEVRTGEFIKLSGCIAVDMEEFYSSETISLDKVGGMLRIGYDLPAGEYKLVSENGRGYYCIYEDLRQDYIIANDNFENSTYVEVKDGQYLILSRCSVVQ